MSLTSYRAAPPRGDGCEERERGGFWSGLAVTYSPASWDAVPSAAARLTSEFGMGSGVSRRLWPPDRIRAPLGDGLGARCGRVGSPFNIICSRSEHMYLGCACFLSCAARSRALPVTGSDQACWTISTGQLSALLRLHLRPIDVVVCHGPQGDLVLRGASRLDAFSGYPVRS